MESEYHLIRQILLGKNEVFEQLVLNYQNLVFTVCLHIIGNEFDAEDIAQESFLAAYRALANFHGSSFKSWLCKIAVNKSIDYKRKQSKADVVDYALQEPRISDGDTVENLFLQNERKEKLEYILSDLSVKYATVIRAFYYDRLSVKEIAQWLALPEKTVEVRLYRARRMIKERWEKDGI